MLNFLGIIGLLIFPTVLFLENVMENNYKQTAFM
jgi:hypothetical protein